MAARYRSGYGIVGLIYIVIGVIVAWDQGYLGADLLRRVVSALLSIFLWFLVLLGVDMHIDT
jgi:nicotinamide riboside transporter PnuC